MPKSDRDSFTSHKEKSFHCYGKFHNNVNMEYLKWKFYNEECTLVGLIYSVVFYHSIKAPVCQ